METKRVLVVSLVLCVSAAVGDTDVPASDPPCVDGWMTFQNSHVIGGIPKPSVSDLEACKGLCVATDGCLGIDWDFGEPPYRDSLCWLHLAPYDLVEDVIDNPVVHHHSRCEEEFSYVLHLISEDDSAGYTLPATMPIFGQSYDEIYINDNGFLYPEYIDDYCLKKANYWMIGVLQQDYNAHTDETGVWSRVLNGPLLESASEDVCNLAAEFQGQSCVFRATTGVTFEWREREHYGPDNTDTFAVQLLSDGNISYMVVVVEDAQGTCDSDVFPVGVRKGSEPNTGYSDDVDPNDFPNAQGGAWKGAWSLQSPTG